MYVRRPRRPLGRIPDVRDPQTWDALVSGEEQPKKPEKKEPPPPPKPRLVVDVYRGDKHVQEIFQ
jgi:hypothetical protein